MSVSVPMKLGIVARIHHFLIRQGMWRALAWGIVISITMDGSSLFANGQLETSPSYALLRHYIPYGLRAYGVIMLAFAAAIMYASSACGQLARYVFMAFCVFSIWMTCACVGGWVVASQVSVSGLSKWFLLTWISMWLAAFTPDPVMGGDDVR